MNFSSGLKLPSMILRMTEPVAQSTYESEAGKSYPQWMWYALLGTIALFLASMFFSIAVNSISLGLIGILWVAIMAVRKRFDVTPTVLDYFFLAYFIAEYLSAFFGYDVDQALVFSKRLLLITVVYFFATIVTREELAKRIVAVLLGSAVVVASLGVLKLIFARPEETVRLGIFQFYMTTSELMMVATLLIVPFIVHERTPKRIRWLAAAGLIPVVISLYATVTRGAYLAAGAGILFIAVVRNKKLLIPFLAVLVLLIVFAPPYVENRVRSIVDLHHPENASRLMLWTLSLKIVEDNPVLGVGDIDLHRLFEQYAPAGTPMPWGHAHNTFLQLLVTLGIVGFTAVMFLFVMMFVVEWIIYRRVKSEWFSGSFVLGALAVFIGIQVNGLTEWTFGDQEIALLLWTTLGLAIAVGRMHSFKS